MESVPVVVGVFSCSLHLERVQGILETEVDGMTKSPDEIKKGLECHARPCGCDMGCPYVEECSEDEGWISLRHSIALPGQ